MFLKNLVIKKGDEIIRNILFHKGANLIIDETPENNKQQTGNNVGKTTVLRLIDYCLGSKGDSIYKDTEFKDKSNTEVKNLLENPTTIIQLVLKKDMDNHESEEIIIERNFSKKKDKVLRIDKKDIPSHSKFCQQLKEIIYHSNLDTPSFRQIIARNIRDEKDKLSNVIKIWPYATKEQYESIYLFWLGIEIQDLDKKREITDKVNLEKRLQQRLASEHSSSQIEQTLLVLNKDIERLEDKKSAFNIEPDHLQKIKIIDEKRNDINNINTKLSSLKIRRALILESKQKLEKDIAHIDVKKIKHVYEQAKQLNPSIQKTFEETVTFHNQMIVNKIEYITKEFPQLDNDILLLERKHQALLDEESKYADLIKKQQFMQELEHIIKELNHVHEQKGQYEEKRQRLDACKQNIKKYNQELDTMNEKIGSKGEEIKRKVAIFNQYFSELSHNLYEEKFILSADSNEEKGRKSYQLNISSIENPGIGKKKGQIAAFDLAYIQFADELEINCPHFILHDQLETVHENQLLNVLENIVPKINCQYIVPILKDKLPKNLDIAKYEILKLSQNNKLFKL